MITASHPIGIFDSGVGGLTVWKELINALPQENFIYYGDSANAPYGPKPEAEILELCIRSAEFLISKNVKLIVVACNTATAAAIEHLRKSYTIPFVGMEPAIKPAALSTKSGTIGILATEGTLNGKLFQETKNRFGQGVEIDLEVANDLVELVEAGKRNSDEARKTLERYLRPMMTKGADHLVLGCTHYPLLADLIKEIVGDSMEIVDPAPAIASRVLQILRDLGKLNNVESNASQTKFYSSSNLELLESLAKDIQPSVATSFEALTL